MQQGMRAVLLFFSILLGSSEVFSREITSEEVNEWLADPQTKILVDQLFLHAVTDDIDHIIQTLAITPLPKQEVARFFLLRKITAEKLLLTPKMVRFIQTQRAHPPIYSSIDQGDGYIAQVPIFNVSLVANRLINDNKKIQSSIDVLIEIESQDIVLAQWLNPHAQQHDEREELLLKEADNLSPQAIEYLVEQIVGGAVIDWLPSSNIVIKLAQLSDDPRLYEVLWKMKADKNIEKEVTRLASLNQDYSVPLLLQAANNPSLKVQAINELIQLSPMTEPVQNYLVSQLNHKENAPIIAVALLEKGYGDWIIDLMNNGAIKRSQMLADLLPSAERQ